jgi:hypothetical protein
MKTVLNLLGQLGKINFRDSRFADQHNAVGFDSADLDVLVFFPINRFEIVSESNGRGT